MKKLYSMLALLLCVCLLVGCAGPAAPPQSGSLPDTADSALAGDSESAPTANPQVEQLHIWQADPLETGLDDFADLGINDAAKSPAYLFILAYRVGPGGSTTSLLLRSGLDGSAAIQLPLPTPHAEGDASRFTALAADAQDRIALLETVYEPDGSRSFYMHRLTADGTPLEALLLDVPGDAYFTEFDMPCTDDGTCYLYDQETLVEVSPDGSCRELSLLKPAYYIRALHAAGGYLYVQYYRPDHDFLCQALRLEVATGETAELPWRSDDREMTITGDAAGAAWGYNLDDGIFDMQTETPALACSWMNTDLSNRTFSLGVYANSDGSFFTVGRGNDWYGLQAARLYPADPATVPQKTIVTVCGPGLRDKILRFNRSSDTVRVVLADYTTDGSDYFVPDGGTLQDDLAAGDGPDVVLYLSDAQMVRHAAAGYLTDLYPLLDADSQLSRKDFWPGPLTAGEVDGKLACLLTQFSIATVAAPTDLVGTEQGWSWQQFADTLAANPQLISFAGVGHSDMLYQALVFWGQELYDPIAGVCRFDSPAFIRLLELAATLPQYPDSSSTVDQLGEGQALGFYSSIWEVRRLQRITDWYGQEVTLKGFPDCASPTGGVIVDCAKLSITESCADKQAAWEFVRSLLTAENQYADSYGTLALRKDVLQRRVEDSATPPQDQGYYDGPTSLWLGPVTDSQLAQMTALLENTNVLSLYSYDQQLYTIFEQCTQPYFDGQITAAQAAADLQQRMTDHLNGGA